MEHTEGIQAVLNEFENNIQLACLYHTCIYVQPELKNYYGQV